MGLLSLLFLLPLESGPQNTAKTDDSDVTAYFFF